MKYTVTAEEKEEGFVALGVWVGEADNEDDALEFFDSNSNYFSSYEASIEKGVVRNDITRLLLPEQVFEFLERDDINASHFAQIRIDRKGAV